MFLDIRCAWGSESTALSLPSGSKVFQYSPASAAMGESIFRPEILRGRVALITGGGSGIGYEIATQFGNHGAKIAIMGRRKQVLDEAVASLQALGLQAVGFAGDVRKKEDAANVVEATVAELGRLDILVNSAAGNFLSPAEDLSPNGFRTVLDIDSVGTFTMCHAAVQYLKNGGQGKSPTEGGVILNISATLHYTAEWYQIHVSAAKAAVDSITRSLALEWGTDYGIRSVGIAPGPIEGTPGMDKLAPAEAGQVGALNVPLNRMGTKSEIAFAAVYLVSDAAKYINGATLPVDGGGHVFRPRRIPKEAVRGFTRIVEQRSRTGDSPNATPASKL